MIKGHAERITDRAIGLLAEERKRQGMSFGKLAEKTGLHRSAISLIESRKRRPTLLVCTKIALVLGVSLSEVIKKAENR